MYAVLALSLVLQFFNSFPTIAGDCYDSPLNNKSYDNCATCYQTLANALINTGDNKYRLGRSFSPDNAVTPVEVRVEYVPESQCNTEIFCEADETPHTEPCTPDEEDQPRNGTTRWYWLAEEFYAFQPLNLLEIRSLFFSPPSWRKECVVLCLPDECLLNISADFFQYLTQRLMIYTTFQNVEARVYMSYDGTAINGDCQSSILECPLKGSIQHGIIAAGYALPFATIIMTMVMTCKILYNGKKFLERVEKDIELQGNFVATSLICCFVTLYILALDLHSIKLEWNDSLPGYYLPKQNYFFYITYVFFAITFFLWVIGIILFFFIYLCDHEIDLPMTFCILTTVLALSFHFQTILIAWAIAPFYAGRILLYYGVIIFVYFLSLKYTYILSVELYDGEKYRVVFSLLFTTVVVSVVVATVAIFVVYVPTINSIEEFAVGITTIYIPQCSTSYWWTNSIQSWWTLSLWLIFNEHCAEVSNEKIDHKPF